MTTDYDAAVEAAELREEQRMEAYNAMFEENVKTAYRDLEGDAGEVLNLLDETEISDLFIDMYESVMKGRGTPPDSLIWKVETLADELAADITNEEMYG